MIAPSYDILMDFDGQMALACQNVFVAAGFMTGPTAPPALPQDGNLITTPDFRFHFSEGGMADTHWQLVWGYKAWDTFKGILDVEIRTSRTENTAASLGLYRSRVRQVFNLWRGRFGPSTCPYYLILDIYPRGSTPSVDAGDDMDVCGMHFEIKFQVNPDAWPQPENQQTLVQVQQFS